MQTYSTLYEFSPLLFHGTFFLMMLAIVACLLVFTDILSTVAAKIGATVALLVLCWSTAVAATQHRETVNRVSDGRVSLVEGVVHSVSQQCRDGGQEFSVNSVKFPADCGIGPGFVPGMPWAKPIHEGLYARVSYFDASWGQRIIVRLETR